MHELNEAGYETEESDFKRDNEEVLETQVS